ncbi:ABC transporter substrate-binding protein [Mesorhizobium sp. 10J20-29]
MFKAIAKAAIVLVGIAIGSNASNADPLNIRIGWSTMPGHMIPVLYLKPEILKHYGTSYTVEPIKFKGSSPQISALAAKEIDMAAFGPLVLALAVNNAHLDVKLVADILQDGANGYHSSPYLVRTDSGIETVEDLKGKRIATNAIGSSVYTAMQIMFGKHGLVDKRDYTMIEVGFPNIPAMLEERKVDLGPVLHPMSADLLATGNYKVLFRTMDAVGPSQSTFLVARGEVLAEHRDQMMDFFEDHVRAYRWFADPANRTEAIGIIAKFMQQDPATLQHLFSKDDYYRDPFLIPNVETVQNVIDITVEAGLSPTDGIEVAPNHVDLSFVEEAKRRIEAE